MFHDLHFLIVDDDPTSIESVRVSLKKMGCKNIKTALSGTEALELLNAKKSHFDCVITDVCMPSGNGLQLLHHIRTCTVARSFRPDMAVVLMSAMASQPIATTARLLDVSGFLVKPFSIHALQQAIIAARRRAFSLNQRRYAGVSEAALQVA